MGGGHWVLAQAFRERVARLGFGLRGAAAWVAGEGGRKADGTVFGAVAQASGERVTEPQFG